MATVMLNGTPVSVGGRFPRVGDTAHSFMLVDTNLQDVPLSRFWGKRKLIAVVPSLDAAIGLNPGADVGEARFDPGVGR